MVKSMMNILECDLHVGDCANTNDESGVRSVY